MKFLGIVVAAALGFALPASADTIANFTLDGVTFDDGGTATGGFMLDLDTGVLSNVNITTSVDGSLPSGFGTTYTDSTLNSFSNNPNAQFGFVDAFYGPFGGDELAINLAVALTATNLAGSPSFSIASGSETFYFVECEDYVCSNRNIVSGSLDVGATPLPAALPLFAGGLGVVGLLAGRRKRKGKSPVVAA